MSFSFDMCNDEVKGIWVTYESSLLGDVLKLAMLDYYWGCDGENFLRKEVVPRAMEIMQDT